MNNYVLTQEKNYNTTITQDQFTPSEARDVVKNLIDTQVNFYKLLQLKGWIGNHADHQKELDAKIEMLQKRKDEFTEIIEQAKKLNCSITVDTSIELKLNK